MEAQDAHIEEAATQKLQASPIYKNYIAWLKSNKVLYDSRLNYPTVFSKGLVGVSTKQKIQPKRVIVAVPFSIVIHSERIRHMEKYQGIIKENPALFNSSEGVIYILCTYLIAQRLKGEKGFYYHYFQVVGSSELLKWNKKEISEIAHPTLMADMASYRQEMEEAFVSLLRVIRTNPDVFPQNLSNEQYKSHFQWAYEFVRTRAFGTSSSSVSLIPLADAFNHGEPSVMHSFIDLEWWRTASEFSYKRQKMNLSVFNDEKLRPTPEQMKLFKQSQASERLKYINKHQQILEGNKDKLSEEKAIERITYLQYNTHQHTLRQLQLFEEDEEADDDESQIDENQYRRYLKKQKQSIKGGKIDSKQLVKQYWSIFQAKTKQRRPKKPLEQEEQSEQEDLSEGSRPSISQSEEESSDSQIQWIDKSQEQNVYFVIHTQTTHEKGEQLYNSYGKRSNNFLLLHYNFAIPDNQYDYYMFRLRIDGKRKKAEELVIYEVPPKKEKGVIVTKQIKVMMNTICVELINHCRYILAQGPLKAIVIPSDKQLEPKALQMAKSIIKHILDGYETSIEEDEQLLENKALNPRVYSALCVRVSHKKILTHQLKLLDKAAQFLGKFKNGHLQLKENQMPLVSSLRPYLQNLERSGL